MQGRSVGSMALQRDMISTVQIQLGRPATVDDAESGRICRVCRHVAALLAASPSIETVDIVGLGVGVERCFRELVVAARRLHRRVVHTASAADPVWQGLADLPRFLAVNRVEVRAVVSPSLAAFERVVATLRALNAAGYGAPDSGLVLILSLHGPAQGGDASEDNLCKELRCGRGIAFTRMENDLARRPAGPQHEYGVALQRWCNPVALAPLACLNSLTVRWDGRLFDCAFNQALGLELRGPRRRRLHVCELRSFDELRGLHVSTASHCLGCTAGLRSCPEIRAGAPAP